MLQFFPSTANQISAYNSMSSKVIAMYAVESSAGKLPPEISKQIHPQFAKNRGRLLGGTSGTALAIPGRLAMARIRVTHG
jgi:hypothetical protein